MLRIQWSIVLVGILLLCSPSAASTCKVDDATRTSNQCYLQAKLLTSIDLSAYSIEAWIRNNMYDGNTGPVGEIIVYRDPLTANKRLVSFDSFDQFAGGIFRDGDGTGYAQLLGFSGVAYKLTLIHISKNVVTKVGDYSSRSLPRLEYKNGNWFVVVRKDIDEKAEIWIPIRKQ